MVMLVITCFMKKRKNRRRNTALVCDPKEDKLLLYFPLYLKQLEQYTKKPWPQGLITESVTEDKVWGFLFYQAHWNKRKQGGRLKAGKTRISTINIDTKFCAALLMRSLTGTTALVENCDRYKFLGYYQLNQYQCKFLKLLKKQRYAGQSVIYTDMIRYMRLCMLTKTVKSSKVKYAKSTYKEKTTSAITPYHLVGQIQRIKEALWEHNKRCKNYSLDGLRDRMCFLMTKYGILCGKSFFRCELSDFWVFMKTYEDPHSLHCVVMTIFQGKINSNRTLYGRFCRSVNERSCPVGAIFMYLF